MKTKRLSLIAIAFAVAFAAVPPALAQTNGPPAAAAVEPSADEDPLSTENVLRDPAIPAMGNPKGDITIVEYYDYRCPYCKKVSPVLNKVVKDDGHIRLVFKDWPVFGDVSIYAARLSLAAKYQNKYPQAHEALISATERLTEASVQAMLTAAGIDVARATRS